jgi:hypothetical protein
MLDSTALVARLDRLEAPVIGAGVLFSLKIIIGFGLVAWRRGRRR